MIGHPTPPTPPRSVPGRGWYALSAALMVLSLAVGAAVLIFGVRQINDQVSHLQRVAVPGFKQVHLDPGSYTMFYETPNAPHRPSRPVRVNVLAPDGSSVAIHVIPFNQNETYEAGGHQGAAVATFNIARAGLYSVSVTADSPEAGADLALGNVNVIALVLGILGGIGVWVVGLGLALTILVVTLIRRQRVRSLFRY